MNLFKLILLFQLIVKKSIFQMEDDKYWLNYINSDRLEASHQEISLLNGI